MNPITNGFSMPTLIEICFKGNVNDVITHVEVTKKLTFLKIDK